jgi:hypothetical protein
MSRLVSEHYDCNTSRTTIFLKTFTVRKHLDAHIMTIVVITGGKITDFYFLYLLYAIYYSVATHLRKDKKVSILPSGDVNHGLISSK